mmetsp:Transcript_16135/g.18087  ORF Transcript_16135/g.18087 Transcript_16135/m.18087 type:complete len:105 (-) Transcript_16135:192-506(-)
MQIKQYFGRTEFMTDTTRSGTSSDLPSTTVFATTKIMGDNTAAVHCVATTVTTSNNSGGSPLPPPPPTPKTKIYTVSRVGFDTGMGVGIPLMMSDKTIDTDSVY